ncbi:hypothetical protein HMPREF1531_02202 [Propionibacterium sp. oral taxon 192 str. F0372]|uniref:DUF5998 family protein n=1 Tax=Propionibacterium sp. oral taxon 192 TaxID=671222 RepID=UPI000352B072|nr:DUF5998 family protein [Propionibacterium sp. oral taxon 192]EPH02886.1 hypothetical protein HMPREF1531_02202 [Propionibacterium sp. oral taxon 192 str. F0372]
MNPPVFSGPSAAALDKAIIDAGFYPGLVADSAALALGGEPVEGFLVHHEATFAHDALGRHISVLVLTPTRLVVVHTDDRTDDQGKSAAISSSETVSLDSIRSVALTRAVSAPEAFGTSGCEVTETWLSVVWGNLNKIDLEPASCGDPNCDADHGYAGAGVAEDLVIRISATGDGNDSVAQLVAFATQLTRRVR